MTQNSARRFALALVLGASTFTAAGVAHAGVTGTDPCPKNWVCATGGTTTAAPAPTTTSTSTTGTVVQALLVLVGAA